MTTNLKQYEINAVCGGKALGEHICSIAKEVTKAGGLAYCIAIPPEREDILGRIGRLNDPQRRAMCSAIAVGIAEIMYHVSETVFGFDRPTTTNSTKIS